MSGPFQDESASDDPPPPPPDGPGLFGGALPEATPEPSIAGPYRVLARKYRPTRFDDLIGQEAIVRTLRNAFAIGRVAHAFMLTGVRGVGKTTTARIIARALNCTGPDGTGGPTSDPCGVCPNCLGILAERHPDVLEMDAASRTGVDDVREIIEATRFRPMQARTKVFIVDEVHMLSRAAFNALLKTLEEPPPHVKFVFATTELRKVPVTVLSRCQRFDLRRVRVSELHQHFVGIARKEGVEIEPGALDLIARAADGSVRDGLSLLDQAIAQADGAVRAEHVSDMLGLADRDAVFDLLEAVMGGKPAAALALTDRAYERGADLGTLLQDLLDLLHTITRLKSIPGLRDGSDLPEIERTRGAALADRLSVPVLARAWQMLLKGVGEVEAAPDRRAAAEMVLIRLCHVGELPTPGDLVRRLTNGGSFTAATPSPASPPGPGTPAPSPAPGGFVSASVTPPSSPGPSSGAVAMAGSAALALARAEVAPAVPRLAGFRDVVALVKEQREAMLHAHLVHSVHLVRFAPPVIELRPQPDTPRDLASKLAALLSEATGTRWTIALSAAMGEPTLAEQGNAADAARRTNAADHPLVRAILETFPGARIETVHDVTTDAYGLPLSDPMPLGEPDMPEFAPPDAELMDDMEPDL
jgi:DNA polymerase-3 subunit gamma/tau